MKTTSLDELIPAPKDIDVDAAVWTPTSALPQAVREWGYVPDFKTWHPGDLVLTKSTNPDRISREIQKIQALGYGDEFASWTHAAVYLGDGLMLCEAQLDPFEGICSVITAKIWAYVGTHHICVRRSRHAADKESGWAIATAAATKIGSEYDWEFIVKLSAARIFVGDKIWQQDQTGKITSSAFVCSSLYSTAHAYVTDVSITDKTNGLCVPAYLASQTNHLTTVKFSWQKIP
jgi:hypothetical protein